MLLFFSGKTKHNLRCFSRTVSVENVDTPQLNDDCSKHNTTTFQLMTSHQSSTIGNDQESGNRMLHLCQHQTSDRTKTPFDVPERIEYVSSV